MRLKVGDQSIFRRRVQKKIKEKKVQLISIKRRSNLEKRLLTLQNKRGEKNLSMIILLGTNSSCW